jgi:hypothetical protein
MLLATLQVKLLLLELIYAAENLKKSMQRTLLGKRALRRNS